MKGKTEKSIHALPTPNHLAGSTPTTRGANPEGRWQTAMNRVALGVSQAYGITGMSEAGRLNHCSFEELYLPRLWEKEEQATTPSDNGMPQRS